MIFFTRGEKKNKKFLPTILNDIHKIFDDA